MPGMMGWDDHQIVTAIMIANNSLEDISWWGDERIAEFLEEHRVVIGEEATGLWTYTLHIYSHGRHLADVVDRY